MAHQHHTPHLYTVVVATLVSAKSEEQALRMVGYALVNKGSDQAPNSGPTLSPEATLEVVDTDAGKVS